MGAGGIVYLVTCRANSRTYVGQTIRTLEVRWAQHRSESKRNARDYPLYRAIKKYGAENFDVRVLEVVPDLRDLNEREAALAVEYHAVAPEGYSLKVGNGRGCIVSQITRERMSAAAKLTLSDPAVRARNAVIHRAAQLRPEVVARKARAISNLWTNPTYRDKETSTRRSDGYRRENSRMRRAEWTRPGTRETRSATMKRVANDPVHWRTRTAAQNRPATVAKRSESMRLAWADPEKRHRLLAGRTDRGGSTVRR